MAKIITDSPKLLIVLVGATAVGKTDLSLDLAQSLNTVILSADSRQVFREMNIGTAKPTAQQLAQVKHYFINSHSIFEEFSAGQFEQAGLDLLKNIFQEKNIALLVGGSGFYVKALCQGIDQMPTTEPAIRAELQKTFEQNGIHALLAELQEKDEKYFEIVDKNNHQRLMRALEVIRQTGKTYSEFRKKNIVQRDFHILKIGLQRPREQLYERIDQRMDTMLQIGLFEEAQQLYPLRHLNALQTVGYQEIFDFLDKQYDYAECVRLLKRNSRHYAKRQMTWFRADHEIFWFDAQEQKNIHDFIQKQIQILGISN